ncbi:MAG: SMC-Scp complex subunit ScpB [Candidatus Omnitrophica bacterium]|nr:SMC-Scp complex subunit ScpB [Candidatus Omnitrophota bacterium]
MDTSANEYLKGAIEALLFISEKPVALDQIAEVMQESVGAVDVRKLVAELCEEYETKQRGMVIVEIAGGYQMLSSPHYVSYVRSFLKTKVKEKLSRPALEALAIVAYKQPVSRGDIEVVRGVNSDGVALHLLNKGLIKIVGKKDVPGRPYLYGTSKLFLEYFGLKSLRDLPRLEDVSLLLAKAEENTTAQTAESAIVESQIESNADASRALDEAEAQAAKESRTSEIIDSANAQESVEDESSVSQQITEHIKAAHQNVEEILPQDEIENTPKATESSQDQGEDIQRGY